MVVTTFKSSALSINTPFIFEILLTNGALFLNAILLLIFELFGLITVVVPFTTIYALE